MRTPAPIRESFFSDLVSIIKSQSWKEWFGKSHDYYNEVLRWTDPGYAQIGQAEPATKYKRVGLIAYANGTNWNPGRGAGCYLWTGTVWQKLRMIGDPPDYESPGQTITSAGALPLAHGLGIAPKLVQVWLKCLTAEGGYSIGDTLPTTVGIGLNASTPSSSTSIVPDSVNLNIRYSNAANVFGIINKTTGAYFGITNGNWNAIFRAWA